MRWLVLLLLAGCSTDVIDQSGAEAGAVDRDAEALDAETDAVDSGDVPIWETDLHCPVEPDRDIPAGMSFGESSGCNQCYCVAAGFGGPCDGSVCEARCTAAYCDPQAYCTFDGGPDAGPVDGCVRRGPEFPKCRSHADCNADSDGGYGLCMFEPGCADPIGYCTQVQSTCGSSAPQPVDPSMAQPPMRFCGCDGVTYASSCPTIPYEGTGSCP